MLNTGSLILGGIIATFSGIIAALLNHTFKEVRAKKERKIESLL